MYKGRHHTSICNHSTTSSHSGKSPAQSSQTSALPLISGTQASPTTVQPNPTQQSLIVSTPTTVQSAPPSTTLNPAAPTFTSAPTSTSLYVDASKTVLLQTALTKARDPSLALNTRLILDSGSQCSYITERAKNFVKLERIKTQKLSIATFGASRSSTKCSDVIQVGINTVDGEGEIFEVIVVSHICQPLSAQSIDLCSNMYKHLASLNLTDTHHSDIPLEIDVLVGLDLYGNSPLAKLFVDRLVL